MPRLRAILFDFDGLLLDTESACFASWQWLFREHGQDYPLEDFLLTVGTHNGVHDPRKILEKKCGRPLDWVRLDAERRSKESLFGAGLEIMPGVRALIGVAAAAGLRQAVVSSSSHEWVRGHLGRHGIESCFDTIVCRGDAPRVKPEPNLYLEAIRRLAVEGHEALALEDSHNGSLAAKRAGLWCVVVPNAITDSQDFSHADARVESIEGLTLPDLERRLGLDT